MSRFFRHDTIPGSFRFFRFFSDSFEQVPQRGEMTGNHMVELTRPIVPVFRVIFSAKGGPAALLGGSAHWSQPMHKKLNFAFVAVAALGVAASAALGRRIENWPYERLFKESDLAVIATAVSTAEADDRLKDNAWNAEFLGQTTTFIVKSTLKGKLNGDTIKVLHYKLKKEVGSRERPLLVTFRTKGPAIQTKTVKAALGTPDYLLFLKARKDGRYEPVSGQIDPQLSVREMYWPLPNFEKE
jgi:hypothetical protein